MCRCAFGVFQSAEREEEEMNSREIVIVSVYLLVNIVVFVMYGVDKSKARHKKHRIPEATLMTAALFGVMGALVGMITFHHKTRKPKFIIGVPLILIAETVLAALLLIHRISGH